MTMSLPREPTTPLSVRISAAVRLTGISRSTLYKHIAAGEIETAKVGASTLVMFESLRAFVERRRSPTTPKDPDDMSDAEEIGPGAASRAASSGRFGRAR